MENNQEMIFVARNYPPAVGGAQTLNQELYDELSRFISIEILANTKWQQSPFFFLKALMEILLGKKTGRSVLLSDGALVILAPLIKALTTNIVFIKLHGKELVYENPLFRFMVKHSVRSVDCVICISNATMGKALEVGYSRDKCVVIPPGTNANLGERMPRDEAKRLASRIWAVDLRDKRVLLSVGRAVERKGFHWMVEAVMPRILSSRGDVHYLIAGAGPWSKNILDSVARTDLASAVTFLGAVTDEELAVLYSCADLLVVPNIPVKGDFEGFGIVILEANKHDVPVVATSVDGVCDAVEEGVNGFLVKPLSPSTFTRRVIEALNGNLVLNDGKPLSAFVEEHYSWPKISRAYLEVIRTVSEHSRQNPTIK